jgi:hypothetical protein
MEGDALYFSRRAQEEREAAMKAAHPSAREAHLDMAGRYDDLAGALAAHHSRFQEQHSTVA